MARIWTISDLHDDINRNALGRSLRLPRGIDADLLVIAGDIGGRLSRGALAWILEQDIDLPILIAAGNHDFYDSSLDTETGRLWRPPAETEHDVVVLAGDIAGDPLSAASWATRTFGKPVVCVAGNHEFYGGGVDTRLAGAEEINETHDGVRNPIHFLENASVVVAGVRFLGCTLWTDFALHGGDRTALAYAMRDAVRGVPDYTAIRAFMPSDARARHLASRAWLERELAVPFDGPTVVVTHHAPSSRSIAPAWQGATTSPAYASDLEELIERWQPDLWIHGHVHDPFDYRIGATRVVCNPKGFGEEAVGFDPRLVVEV